MQHVIPMSYVPAPSLCQILAHNFVPYKVHHGLVGSALVVSCSDRAWSWRSDAHPYPSWLHRSTRLLADSPWLVGGLSLHVRTPKLAYLQSSSSSLRCRVLQPLELVFSYQDFEALSAHQCLRMRSFLDRPHLFVLQAFAV